MENTFRRPRRPESDFGSNFPYYLLMVGIVIAAPWQMHMISSRQAEAARERQAQLEKALAQNITYQPAPEYHSR